MQFRNLLLSYTAVACISTSLFFRFTFEKDAWVPIFEEENVVLMGRIDLENMAGPKDISHNNFKIILY